MSRIYETFGPKGYGSYKVDFSRKPPVFERVARAPETLLVPGFVDLHIHGAFGIDFMQASEAELRTLCQHLASHGYEGFLPTTITASAPAVLHALSRLPDHPMILGFHLEGPFISREYPGAQPQTAIVEPRLGKSDWDAVLDSLLLKVITLAPELPHALELTARLIQRGVIVSMGHSNATYEEARRGFEFGASHVTHAFNAMRPFHHREPGMVGYLLANKALVAELIYDRKHVSTEAAAMLLQCKSRDKVIAVSDSTMATGLPAGTSLDMWGAKCVVGKGEVRLESGALAGSAITLLDAFRNLAQDFGNEVAVRTCCVNPRRALRISRPPSVYIEMDRHLQIVERHQLIAA